MIVGEFEEENRFNKPKILKTHGVASGASVIIGSMGKTFGVLIVNSTKKRKFTSDDTYFLNSVAFLITQVVERKQMEDARRESEERLRFALETSHIGAWDLDVVDHTSHRSLEHDRIFGYEQLLPQWTYEMFLDHVLPEDRAMVDAKFHEATTTHSDWNFECRIRRVDGKVRRFGRPGSTMDATGSALRMAGIVQDITERKQSEEELWKSENRFRAMFEEHGAPMLLIEPNSGQIIDANEAAARFYEYSREQLRAMYIDQVNQLPPKEVATERYKAIERSKNVFVFTHRLASGDERLVEVYSSPVTIEGRSMLFSIIHDITLRKKAEEALKKAHENLEEKVKERTEELEIAYESLKSSKLFANRRSITG